jgi:hypothetical protein
MNVDPAGILRPPLAQIIRHRYYLSTVKTNLKTSDLRQAKTGFPPR